MYRNESNQKSLPALKRQTSTKTNMDTLYRAVAFYGKFNFI
jgi:hypothetical protein